jgi:cathepsin L
LFKQDNKGMEAEASYNYFEEYTGSCQYAAADKKLAITGYTFVATNEAALQAAVAIQPVAVALDSSPSSFQYYSSGIYYDSTCSSTK